jgi:hypothetical protein
MQRARIIRAMDRARRPIEIADALIAARVWLARHPDDEACRVAMAAMLGRERVAIRG